MFERISRTVTSTFFLHNTDKVRNDLAIQRNMVWNAERQSLLIHSMIIDYPIPPIFAQDTEDGYLWVLDGKQRIETIITFLNNDFKIHPNTPEVNGETITNLHFFELPEQIKRQIENYKFLIYGFRGMTEAERDEMFLRLNNFKPLTHVELIRVRSGPDIREYTQKVAKMHFINESCNLTSGAKKRFKDEEIVMQCLVMFLTNGREGLSSKTINKYMLYLKENPLQEKKQAKFEGVLKFLGDAFTYKERFLKKVHIPIIFYAAERHMEKEDPKEFAFKVKNFYRELQDPKAEYFLEYKAAMNQGSARSSNVIDRVNALQYYLKNTSIEDIFKEQEEITQ